MREVDEDQKVEQAEADIGKSNEVDSSDDDQDNEN